MGMLSRSEAKLRTFRKRSYQKQRSLSVTMDRYNRTDEYSEEVNALEVMENGTPISLYTTTWSGTDFRMFQITRKHDAIIYSNVTKMGVHGEVSEDQIPIKSITSVSVGQQSELFKDCGQKELVPLCFSIEYH